MTAIVRRLALAALASAAIGLAPQARAVDIAGAGATFPYPVYAKWAEAFKASTGIAVNYQSIGSGGGIKQIKSKTVDFGASDMPLTATELEKSGLAQFPTVLGGVVPVVNVKGIQPGQLKLTGELLADIYLGKVAKWNDKAIAALNPGMALPNQGIGVVHRSDGSGTTFLFTDYLSKISPEWKQKVGANTAVEWPVGLGGKGNEGVAALTARTDGAIGYVEYAYAKQNKLAFAQLRNAAGQFVAPESKTFQAAAAGADWAGTPGFAVVLTNLGGAESWPITGATFVLIYKKQAKPDNAKAVLQFFDWAYASGDKLAEDLDYVPMPDKVVELVHKAWREVVGPDGKPVFAGGS